ncbi:hypothetical protein [Aureimonas glaciei]|uniref:hypothetical protein n=1 Tax=Aureimonas glaciei TaxID=1776957 RepID=UPI001666987F|nr:hypothetical protein [Aureimonas glaciei]
MAAVRIRKAGGVATIGPSGLLLLASFGPATAIGDFGPDTCAEGFVWREAGPNDHVCVSPETRDQARRDNAEAASRVQPGGGAWGPDTCKQGYVWREAFGPADHVCVAVETRTTARNDNRQAGERKKYPICQTYARDAIQTAAAAVTFNCMFSGPRWDATYDQHFHWCLDNGNRAISREIQGRGTELVMCQQNYTVR